MRLLTFAHPGSPCKVASWEPTVIRPRSLSGVALDGDNLVRLIYVDETGISVDDKIVVVAGVIIKGDKQWKAIEAYIEDLIKEYVPAEHRENFVFHAKDLYHGTGATPFDRRTYPRERAHEALIKLLGIPRKFRIPIVFGFIRKPATRLVRKRWLRSIKKKTARKKIVAQEHSLAFAFCAVAAERYMRDKTSRSELARFIAENNTDTHEAVDSMQRLLKGNAVDKNPPTTAHSNWGPTILPIRRIVDTVHFINKAGSMPLQIADACALIVRYSLEFKPNVERFFTAITGNSKSFLQSEFSGKVWGCGLLIPTVFDSLPAWLRRKRN